MIDSHLHFDHGGGNTYRDEAGVVRPTFAKARYVVQRGELEYASHTNERTAASYFPHNFAPIVEAGLFDLVEGEKLIVPGITRAPDAWARALPPGDPARVEGGARVLSRAISCRRWRTCRCPWIMGYDVEPLVTLETKRRTLARALKEDWLLIFEHDATHAWGRLAHDGKAYRWRP